MSAPGGAGVVTLAGPFVDVVTTEDGPEYRVAFAGLAWPAVALVGFTFAGEGGAMVAVDVQDSLGGREELINGWPLARLGELHALLGAMLACEGAS